MLWSQLKLTSYDFSDLHVTGEFDNRPSTGRYLRIFLLLDHIAYGRRPGSVYINIGRCPSGVVRNQSGTEQSPYDCTQMKRTCNDVYTYIKCRQYFSNETAFTLRKT